MRAALLLLFAAFAAGCDQAPQPPPAITEAQVLDFVRTYVGATNEGDATKVVNMIEKGEAVTSVAYGELFRGWNEIRNQVDAGISEAARTRFTLATITVRPLGPDAAIAVAPFSMTLIAKKGMPSVPGAATLVVQRFPDGLRLIHEHYSLKLSN